MISANAQTGKKISAEAETYLTYTLGIMEKNALLKKEVNWLEVRRKTFEKASNAQETIDTWDAIRFALSLIGDQHSFLQLTEELTNNENVRRNLTKQEVSKAKRDFLSPYISRRKPEGFVHKLKDCVVGQIVVPLYSPQKGDDFATTLNKFIAETDKRKVCGWIVDLRGNTGGNVFPMLAGIGALLDEGNVSYALDADGGKTFFFYKNGQSGLIEPGGKETVVTKIEGAAYKTRRKLPVAVLIDKGTASSGEGVAIAFRGRRNTRFFGVHTYGVSTSNEGFPLSDGANIVLTTGVDVDKNGIKYFSGIEPDEVFQSEKEPLSYDNDPLIKLALNWFGNQNTNKRK